MRELLVAYVTKDGHCAEIAERIASELRKHDCAVEMCNLARSAPGRPLQEYDGVVAGGAIYAGKHPPQLTQFASVNAQTLNARPSAMVSVSLSAAGDSKQKADAARCLEEFLKQTGWQPASTSLVAGALMYRKYGFFKRWMMKMIVKRQGGDTDTSRNYIYTDWEAVNEFARQFADRLAQRWPAETKARAMPELTTPVD